MAFSNKMKEFLEKSYDASKDFINKAGNQAQVWSEMGKLKLEILQLRTKAQSLTSRLGAKVYELLVEKNEPMIGTYSEGVAPLIEELKRIDADIAVKEAAFRQAGGVDADLDGDGKPDR
jgi:predicted secreted protein